MADTQEFLDKLLREEFYVNEHEDCDDSCSYKWAAEESFKRAKEAILQHFQQEQERAINNHKEVMKLASTYTLKDGTVFISQSEVDRLIREAEDKVADWFDDGLPSGFTPKEWYASYRFAKERLSKQKEGSK